MTIRVRLTVLVAFMTAVLSSVGLWLGLSVLRDFASQGSLDSLVQDVALWLVSVEGDLGETIIVE